MTILGLLTVIAALITYSTFTIGSDLFFRKVECLDKKMKLLIAYIFLSAMYFCVSLLFSNGSLISIFCYFISISFFIYTIFAIRKHNDVSLSVAFSSDLPENLVTSGPYKFIRNPFYTSYLISFIAPIFALKDTFTILLFIGLFAFYYHASRLEEEKFQKSELATAYQKYFERTGRFVPKLSSLIRKTPEL